MASGVFQSLIIDAMAGEVDVDVNTFKIMLVTSGYVPDFDGHDRRNDITNEVTGAGYTAGGKNIAVTLNNDPAKDEVNYLFADTSWAAATITARGAVIYIAKGGAAGADPLVAYVDFGSDKSSLAGTFEFKATSPLKFKRI